MRISILSTQKYIVVGHLLKLCDVLAAHKQKKNKEEMLFGEL